ncbi:MAG: TonB-dependent receptor family protein [Bacteroidales bacterium]|nr:TonB-dependent receptor family protein [Bacteroidales bacterium]
MQLTEISVEARFALTIALMFIGLSASFAQSNISGCVKTTSGRCVDFASVTVAPANTPRSFLTSALTDDSGRFSMTVNSQSDSLVLRASSVEITPASIVIPNRTGRYDIVVEDKTVELREVVVKSKKIYSQGDTINYNVASFLSQNDQVLADVLKKMPGISVSDVGQISYQGKPIKNFYIEGLDLMKGHYGIATNNIDPNNISTVQVLEAHQDIKALKGLRPEEQASINIRLKEGVKGVFNLITTLGGGYGGETLWNNSVMATCFKRNSQFLATYKGNNTGEDLSQELYSFDNDYSRTSEISRISMPSAPGIDKRFYYFNRSHSATFNNVYRVGQSGEFGINTAYLNDRDTRSSHSSTTNILPDGSENIVEEQMIGVARINKAYGDLTYLLNLDQRYLKEQLKFDYLNLDADSQILAENNDISQIGKSESYRLLNKFHFTDRTSEYRGYEIYSIINLEKRPHGLSVNPNLFTDLINENMLYQHVDSRNFSTGNRVGLLSAWRIGHVAIHPNLFVNYDYNSLSSRLDDFRNDLWLGNFSTGLGAEISWRIRKVDLSVFLPIAYKNFRLKNRLSESATDKDILRVEPRLFFSYKINSNHSLNLKSELYYSTPSIQTLYSNYVLTSYRQLSAYEVSGLFEGINLFNSLSYDYKNILTMSFAGLDISWSHQKLDVLYGYYYDGLVERVISQRTDEHSSMFSAKLRGSQGFNWRRLKIGLSATFSRVESPLLVQNSIPRYSVDSYGINGDISLSPFKWLSVGYEGKYYMSASKQQGFGRMAWLKTLTNNTKVDFNLPGGISIGASLYHYYNNFNDGDKSFLLLNAEARYSIKRFSFTLSCDNLLNRRHYLYSNQSALTEERSVYNIRPRSILLKIRLRIF